MAFAIPMIHSILEWRKMRESGVTEEEEEMAEEEEEEPPELVAIDQEEDNLDNDDESSALGCVKVVEDGDINFNPVTSETSCNTRPLLGLVVTPTRELAVQVKHHIDAVAKFSGEKPKGRHQGSRFIGKA